MAYDAYDNSVLFDLNSSLASFENNGGLYAAPNMSPFGSLTLQVPDNYDVPPVYVAPTNSNNVGAVSNVSNTGQDMLSFMSDIGKRLANSAVDAAVSIQQNKAAVKNAQAAQQLRGASYTLPNQLIPGIPNLLTFGFAAAVIWFAVKD